MSAISDLEALTVCCMLLHLHNRLPFCFTTHLVVVLCLQAAMLQRKSLTGKDLFGIVNITDFALVVITGRAYHCIAARAVASSMVAAMIATADGPVRLQRKAHI